MTNPSTDPSLNSSLQNVDSANDGTPGRPRRLLSRFNILIRRIHLYSGLFLIPWVILYGVTGAMFNHLGLFPRVAIQPVTGGLTADPQMQTFPSPEQLAVRVVESLQNAAADHEITLLSNHGAEYTGDLLFETRDGDGQHVVHIDPISRSAWIGTQPPNEEEPELLLREIRNIQLQPDPHEVAREAAGRVMEAAGRKVKGHLQPLGWTKLNFLATVDGGPVRVTYVLKDGHVDINRFTGQDGMPLRQFFLRMHTSHGQPPHWNARMFWSIAVDTMAIAMVSWSLTGIVMWWQIKRTRAMGIVVIILSLITAAGLCMGLQGFYAATRL